MYKARHITDDIYYIGVNDRQKALFENLIPLPHGVSYNSYLIMDEKTVLVDTVEVSFSEVFLDKLLSVLGNRKVDYLVINHMEPDHSGAIRTIRRMFPDMQIVGNSRTFDMLEGFYGIHDGLHEVKDGDTLKLGKHTLKFFLTPMIHWPETMMTYDIVDKAIFTGDAFGAFGTLDGGVLDSDIETGNHLEESRRYFSNIAGKYGSAVQKALAKLKEIEIRTICPTHGPVWREQVDKILSITDNLSRYEGERGVVIAYGSMYGNTEQMAEAIAYGLSEEGEKNITIYNVSKTDVSFILSDIFRYDRVVIGSPTYSNELFPDIASLLAKLETRDIKNRKFAYFGSSTWSNASIKLLAAFSQRVKWDVISLPIEIKQSLKEDKYEECIALGRLLAKV